LIHLSFEYNTAVISKSLQFGFLSIWLIVSVGILAWGVRPLALESRDLFIPDFGLLTLEWNPENRTGDITVVELTLATQNEENLSVVPQPMRIARNSPLLQRPGVNAEKRLNRVVEARLEIPSVNMKPRNTVGQSFQPGDEVVFYWNVNSLIEGDFQGRIWLYTENRPLAEDSENRYPIAVQSVELQWRDLFGLNGMATRYVGITGLIMGIILALILWFRARHSQSLPLD